MPAHESPGLPWQPGEAHRAGVKLEVEEKNAGTEAVDLRFPEIPHKPLVKRPRRAHRRVTATGVSVIVWPRRV